MTSLFTPADAQQIRAHFAAQPSRVGDDVLQLLFRRKLFKLFVPAAFGGLMLPLPEALRVQQACGRLDGNLGWLVVLGSGGGYFTGYFAEAVARDLFGPADAVLAGSGAFGTATRTADTVAVSGRWAYCSGADFASFFTAGIRLDGKELACVLLPSQVTIARDWNGFGLEASSSHSITCDKAEVPQRLLFDLAAPPVSSDEPLYRFPFLAFARLTFGALLLGMTQALLDEAESRHAALARHNARRRAALRDTIDQEAQQLQAIETDFHRSAAAAWTAHTTQGLASLQLNEIDQQVFALSQHVAGLTARLIPHLGMAAIKRDDALNYHYRNLVTANQHLLLRPY